MTSLELSKKLGMLHYSIQRLIEKYKKEFELFGEIENSQKTSKGRPFVVSVINKQHEILIIMLLKNNKISEKIKIIKDIKEFVNE